MSKHTPGPWSWAGEDYRGGWGWQLLVGPSGQGILCGEQNGGPYEQLLAYTAIPAEFCKTGMASDENSAPCVHVMQADARLIAAAPDLLDALQTVVALFDLHDDRKNLRQTVDARNAARAAIARATGAPT